MLRSASPSAPSTTPSRAPTTWRNWSSPATGWAAQRQARCWRSATEVAGSPATPPGRSSVQISRDGDTALVEIPVPTGGIDIERRNTDTLRRRCCPQPQRALPGATAQLTGNDASDVDFTDQMHRMTPLVIAFVLGLAFVLLVCSFRSPLLAASVIGLNLASVGAAFGVLTLVFQHHWAQSLLGLSVVRRDRQLAAAVRVRGPVRPVDGLHGADPRAGARGTPRRGRRPRGGRRRHWPRPARPSPAPRS